MQTLFLLFFKIVFLRCLLGFDPQKSDKSEVFLGGRFNSSENLPRSRSGIVVVTKILMRSRRLLLFFRLSLRND